MNIKNTFLSLTSKTYPYGYEEELESFLPKGFTKDEHGNYFYRIGESETVFTCHLDTASRDRTQVVHKIEGDIIKTNGKSILGADDKAGMTVLLFMIEKNLPGLYCFFVGEEVGCIGSGFASTDPKFKEYKRIISFDRRGTTSVITYQSSKRCCSENFAKTLSNELNKFGLQMSPDDTGVYTDSAEFTEVIPECTNISVGYYKEHTHDEHQDIKHLTKLCNAVIKVDWENLPTERNPKVTEYKTYKTSYPSYNTKNYDYQETCSTWKSSNYRYDEDDYYFSSRGKKKSRNRFGYHDDWYEQNSSFIKPQNKSKVFLDDIENDITDSYFQSQNKSKKYYESLKQIIFDDEITAEDFDRVKEQYLDMSDPQDVDFYLEMKSIL